MQNLHIKCKLWQWRNHEWLTLHSLCGATGWEFEEHPVAYRLITSPVTWRVQHSVTFPIGGHVNVLHDYKKSWPSKILKFLTCRHHHFIDMLMEFSQKFYISNSFKMAERVMPINVYQFLHELLRTRALWWKICQKSFRLLKSSKNPQLHCQHVLPANLPMCLLKCSYVRWYDFFQMTHT